MSGENLKTIRDGFDSFNGVRLINIDKIGDKTYQVFLHLYSEYPNCHLLVSRIPNCLVVRQGGVNSYIVLMK